MLAAGQGPTTAAGKRITTEGSIKIGGGDSGVSRRNGGKGVVFTTGLAKKWVAVLTAVKRIGIAIV